ncbi:MAG: phage holin family protein [Oscillospiraceae bacterium]|nr:phage holin family protein [Oscillospiraceae bacterium]
MEHIKPELIVLIPILIAIGAAAKAAGLKSRFVPLILNLAGIALATLYMFAFVEGETTVQAVFTGIVQGILAAWAAVGGHQNVRQIKNLGNKDETIEESATDIKEENDNEQKGLH